MMTFGVHDTLVSEYSEVFVSEAQVRLLICWGPNPKV